VSRSTVYLDSSALVKLTVAEEHSAALREWLRDRTERASCALARTEVLRAVRAIGPGAVAAARTVLSGLYLVHLDDRLLDAAGTIDPGVLRSLDAIHLAAALSLGDDVSAVVSYDTRMLDGARLLGLPTIRPT
jgi:predicted nucleic acid-binding protein